MAARKLMADRIAPSQTLYLVDISSFIFRAFYAIRQLSNQKGEPTNAVHGVAQMLSKLVDDARPEHMAIVYDSPEPGFREEMYADYKANRSAPPDELEPQFDRIDQLVDALKIPSFRKAGWEADDLIATLTQLWTAEGKDKKVVVVTGDKDLMQLVQDKRVYVWDTMKDKVYQSKEVVEKFGIRPDQVRDYLALVGDSSDNVPGVPSIGPKSAVGLLQEFGNLDGVLKAASGGKVKGKKGEVLKTNVKQARLSQRLVSLDDRVKLKFDATKLDYRFEVTPQCLALLEELEMKAILARWRARSSGTGETPAPLNRKIETDSKTFKTIDDIAAFEKLLHELERCKEFSFDLETTSLDPQEAQIVGIAIAYDTKLGFYIPIGHTQGKQLNEKTVWQKLTPFLTNPKYKKIGQNLKYDWSVLHCHGIYPDGIGADTMVAAYVLEPAGRHNFDSLCGKYLKYSPVKYEEVCGKGKSQVSFAEVDISVATRYAAEDALYTLKLWEIFRPRLEKTKLMDIFAAVDMPLVPVLTKMERQGISIDTAWLKELSERFGRELAQIEQKIQKYAKRDEPVNLNSPKQLQTLLFEDLKLPTKGRKKTGYSTDAKVLEALAPLHEVPRLLVEYREISKLKGTYVDPLPLLVSEKTGKIHASFHQTVAATGRLSSSEPNLQNIPIRTERGLLIRKAFVPSPGCIFFSADYSQIELRLLAHMSDDPALCRAFQEGADVHRQTASDLFGVSLSDVDNQQRGIAKAINFGLMYGKTAFGLAQELKISRNEAKEIIDRYFNKYSSVRDFLGSLISDARKKGWSATLMGRKRHLPDLNSKNHFMRQMAERMAMNTPLQGSAADLMKMAMIHLDEALVEQKLESSVIVQVHDELLVDCVKEESETVAKLVREKMENAMVLKVPLVVNSSFGKNWMELK